MDGGMDSSSDNGANDVRKPDLPDSFCVASTVADPSSTASPAPVTELLRGRHSVARLTPGDVLYLPASWFHEVISRGSDAGGHLALNLWLAPPHAKGSFEAPYEDSFWESKYKTFGVEEKVAEVSQKSVAKRKKRHVRLPRTHRRIMMRKRRLQIAAHN